MPQAIRERFCPGTNNWNKKPLVIAGVPIRLIELLAPDGTRVQG